MRRTAQDYGVPDLTDAVLQELAGNVKKYGEKGRFAGQELAARQGLLGEANTYRNALEKSAYYDTGQEYGQGLGTISDYLARSGPLAFSGAATRLRTKLAADVYNRARSRILGGYADYLGNALGRRRNFLYNKALAELQARQNRGTGFGGVVGGLVGGTIGSFAGGAGEAAGAALGKKLF